MISFLLSLFLNTQQVQTIEPTHSYTTYASWYGPGLYGNKMANGESFKKSTIAAAHRRLPFGTKIIVTNLNNGRSIELEIKDRGPFVEKHKRTLDISYAAAVQLAMISDGVVPVKIEVI